MSNIDKQLDSIFNNIIDKKDDNNLIIWEEDPITFEEFLRSKEHMDFPEYSERQMDAIHALFGNDPKNLFFNNDLASIIILIWGKGSGKDTISCHCILYCVYVLLCCKVPQNMFKGIDSKTVIDILNVASTARQASSIFFTKMKNHVKSWKWLGNKYVIKESGKNTFKDKDDKNRNDIVNIKGDEILFPKNIRALSKHSQQEAAEGCSPLLWVADEFDSFSDKNQKSNAMAMFNALETSMSTRYGKQGKGFVISWPRYDGGPIQKLYELYKNDLRAYVDIASTFEVKPKRMFSDKWVYWRDYYIPYDFLSKFEKNPEDSKAKFLCIPPKSSDPFFTDINKIDACIDKDKRPLFTYREKIIESTNGKLVNLELLSQNYSLPETSFVITGDIGLSNDLTSVAIWHTETLNLANNSNTTMYIQDMLFIWKPDQYKNIRVDIDNVQKIIDALITQYKLPINNIIFDHYNSANLLTYFSKIGISTQAYTLKLQDFYDVRMRMYNGQIKLLNNNYQIEEIKRLINSSNGKPDHVEGGHDDVFRSTCLAIVALSGFSNQNVVVNEDGMFFQKKLTPQMMESAVDTCEPIVMKVKLHQGRGQQDFDPFNLGIDDSDNEIF